MTDVPLVTDHVFDRRMGRGRDVQTITANTARALLVAATRTGPSAVNKSLTKEQALGILTSGIASKRGDEPIPVLVARNILREVGRGDVAKQLG